MKSAAISELKATLKTKPQAQLLELCLRLARFKKDNKELLTFLLYEADDLAAYITNIKGEMAVEFAGINTGNLHWVKKGLRKILRLTNKHIRYSGSKIAETDLRLHFCTLMQLHNIPVAKSSMLSNIYKSQIKKVEAAVTTMHEDLQRDYLLQLDDLKK